MLKTSRDMKRDSFKQNYGHFSSFLPASLRSAPVATRAKNSGGCLSNDNNLDGENNIPVDGRSCMGRSV
jgi:hypothetical protein